MELNSGRTTSYITISNTYRHFLPNYASTIAGIQGRKIDKPFSIWNGDKYFTRDALTSAVGCGACRKHVHFENTDSNIIYPWCVGKKNAI